MTTKKRAVAFWDGCDELLRVIVSRGLYKNLSGRTLDYPTSVEHHDIICDLLSGGEVMGDE